MSDTAVAASIDSSLSPQPHGSIRDKLNQIIHVMYTRHDYDDCLRLINRQLSGSGNGGGGGGTSTSGSHEAAIVSGSGSEYPLYIKGLIRRQQGAIQESLELFQLATSLNPHNITNLKQVGRSLYLLGKHKAAFEVYEEVLRIGSSNTLEKVNGKECRDWEVLHNQGLCCVHMKQFDKAIFCFRKANEMQPHDSTFMQLGKVRVDVLHMNDFFHVVDTVSDTCHETILFTVFKLNIIKR